MATPTVGSLYRNTNRNVEVTSVGGINHGETIGWNGVTTPQAAPVINPFKNP